MFASHSFVPLLVIMFSNFDYSVIGILLLSTFFVFLIAKNRLLQIIIINYCLIIFSLTLHVCFDRLITYLESTPEVRGAFGILFEDYAWFFAQTDTLIIMWLYLLLFLRAYRHSRITSFDHQWSIMEQVGEVLLFPLSITSIGITLFIIFIGPLFFSTGSLTYQVQQLSSDAFIEDVFILSPLILAIHIFLTIFITTYLNFDLNISFRARFKQNPYSETIYVKDHPEDEDTHHEMHLW